MMIFQNLTKLWIFQILVKSKVFHKILQMLRFIYFSKIEDLSTLSIFNFEKFYIKMFFFHLMDEYSFDVKKIIFLFEVNI